MNIENFNRELLAKYLSNEVNSREKLEVMNWLNLSEKNREELEKLRHILSKVDTFYKAKNFDSETAWNKVNSKITQPQLKIIHRKKERKVSILSWYKYAANNL